MNYANDEWAVFWCSLLAPILLEEIEAGERHRYLLNLSQREVSLPNGQRKRLSLSTLKRKVRQFRQQKIAGLGRKRRHDRGQPRKRREEMLRRAIELKQEQPHRSPKVINQFLQREFGRTIPKSTMNYHLRVAGVTRRKLGLTEEKIRCRWTREQSNALWVGDFSQGPCVFHDQQVIKSHLSIWIDCYSRFVVEGRYYFRENLDILVDSLLRAWASHGAPREIYVDNAKVYHAKAFRLACAQLNIRLLHRPPRDPSPGGLVERVIQTAQHQFESEIRASQTVTLDELNRYFQAWLQVSYHQTVHSATEQTPLQRFHEKTRFYRHVNLAEAREFFHLWEQRKVDVEFCDVRINNQYFAVQLQYRGDWVLVSYDPFASLKEVRIYSLHEKFLQVAPRYERGRAAHPFVDADGMVKPSTSQSPLDRTYLEMLETRHREQQQREAEHGVDYHAAGQAHVLKLNQFADRFAKLLGRKGGVSGLSTQELERLTRVHRKHPRITASLLETAFQLAEQKTIPVIIFQLQNLLSS